MISPEEVRKLASLARIQVPASDEAALAKDMDNILDFVKQIQNAVIDPADVQKERVRNVLRPDSDPHEAGIHTEAILAEVPQREGQFVKVKKIL
jgi:aspartyl/glutamyl-tRNA(Asn/Gln) amidotransferase C subunit